MVIEIRCPAGSHQLQADLAEEPVTEDSPEDPPVHQSEEQQFQRRLPVVPGLHLEKRSMGWTDEKGKVLPSTGSATVVVLASTISVATTMVGVIPRKIRYIIHPITCGLQTQCNARWFNINGRDCRSWVGINLFNWKRNLTSIRVKKQYHLLTNRYSCRHDFNGLLPVWFYGQYSIMQRLND